MQETGGFGGEVSQFVMSTHTARGYFQEATAACQPTQ